ncbi:hypothetical protein V865_007321 [Kwoniella europaea PYCC6329]|uniref:EF-hand domain-containing protein n=1 Tax=Kwoniella europaea PYCC6329 TaxID=1423913 RepID=A0AAX4KSK6_9TREE
MSNSSTNGNYTQTDTDFSSHYYITDEERAATQYFEDQQSGKIDWEELQEELALAEFQADFTFDDNSQGGSDASASTSG